MVICAVWAVKPFVFAPVSDVITGMPHLGPLPSLTRKGRSRLVQVLFGLIGRVGKLIPRRAVPVSERVQTNLVYTGSSLTVEEFRGLKVLCAVGTCFAFSVFAFEFGWLNPMFFVLATLTGFIAPNWWLRSRLDARQQAILRLLPEVIDLLSVSVRAGLDFLGAMVKIVSAQEFKKEALIEELQAVLQEIKLGKRKTEALKAMAKRVNLPEMNSFVRTVVQAERMGTPIAEALAIHSDDVRFDRVQRAERAALKAPLKILVPLIFCIMPTVAIIVGAPIFLQFARQNPFQQ
jgi:tight adherence protein C